MALAAAAYCMSAARPKLFKRSPGAAFAVPPMWPRAWDLERWKPKDRRRDLIRAAALIVAEIERLDRAAASTETSIDKQVSTRKVMRYLADYRFTIKTDGEWRYPTTPVVRQWIARDLAAKGQNLECLLEEEWLRHQDDRTFDIRCAIIVSDRFPGQSD